MSFQPPHAALLAYRTYGGWGVQRPEHGTLGRYSPDMTKLLPDGRTFALTLRPVMNSLAMQDGLQKIGVPAQVMSAIAMMNVCEPYERVKAVEHLGQQRVVIFAAGTGNPYFTTDTAAVLRALEIRADVVMKATRVDGVYSDDPEKNPRAVRYRELDYTSVLRDNLQVMDAAGISLARENKLPIFVFNMLEPGNIIKAVRGEDIGTLIGG